MILINLMLHMSESVRVNLNFSDLAIMRFLNYVLTIFFVIISPLKRTWPPLFFFNKLHFHYPWIICTKFDWNWPVGSSDGDFWSNTYKKWFSLLWPHPTPGNRDFDKLALREEAHVNPSFSGLVVFEKILKWPHPIFAFFVIIYILKRIWPFIWTNFNSHYPRIFCISLKSACWF
jgi:hypothetical protein